MYGQNREGLEGFELVKLSSVTKAASNGCFWPSQSGSGSSGLFAANFVGD